MRSLAILVSLCWLASLSSLSMAADTVTLPNCLLLLDEEVQIPAQEAGELVSIPVREGQQVAKGDVLAQIDDLVPKAAYNVALYKLKVAEKQATDDIDVRYAKTAHDFATAKLHRSVKANERTPNTVTEEVIDEQRLDKEKSRLMIDKSQKDLDVAGLQKQVSEAELQAADANLKRRRILAPLDAMVVELSRHEGEWVQAGDTIMRLVRVDQLRVEGLIDAKDFRPSEIQGRPVEVLVTLARAQQVRFPGKVVYVNPLIRTGGKFQVRAEVRNRKDGNFWVLSPGLKAEMTIQLR
jgi:multidrug efflux pump subunit AcrA (membrane-fusion protein)